MSEILAFFTVYWYVLVISNIIAVIFSAILADRKGRSIGGWIFGGIILGWVAVIILAFLSDQRAPYVPKRTVERHYYHNQSDMPTKEPSHRWRCHNCNQLISADPCPFCGQVFSTDSDSDK